MNKDACDNLFNNQFDKLNIDNIEEKKLHSIKLVKDLDNVNINTHIKFYIRNYCCFEFCFLVKIQIQNLF